jgi:hypothetical protein
MDDGSSLCRTALDWGTLPGGPSDNYSSDGGGIQRNSITAPCSNQPEVLLRVVSVTGHGLRQSNHCHTSPPDGPLLYQSSSQHLESEHALPGSTSPEAPLNCSWCLTLPMWRHHPLLLGHRASCLKLVCWDSCSGSASTSRACSSVERALPQSWRVRQVAPLFLIGLSSSWPTGAKHNMVRTPNSQLLLTVACRIPTQHPNPQSNGNTLSHLPAFWGTLGLVLKSLSAYMGVSKPVFQPWPAQH